jgi:hypothetical protein
MENRETTIARLRKQLGREPTDEEVKLERDNEWELATALQPSPSACCEVARSNWSEEI